MAKKKSSLSATVSPRSDELQPLNDPPAHRPTSVALDSILPDPGQPRRLLPDDLAEAVSAGNLSPLDALQEWHRRAESTLVEVALQHNIRELKRLADSIAQHGLISPISVRLPQPDESTPPGVIYFIVTGERRYWAHVYLRSVGRQIQAGETLTSPDEIKVSLAPSGITVRAHQLIENLLREDLNAIERARGMWALRYELSGVNYSSPPADIPETEASVADGSPLSPTPDILPEVNYSSPQLVPWARVEESLGISKRYRIFVIAVLNLSEAAQALVASHNLAEMTIRPITQKLKDKPELQLQALRQLIEWQAGEEDEGPGRPIVASIKELVDQLLIDSTIQAAQSETVPLKPIRAVSSAPVARFRDKVRQTLDFLNRLKKSDRVELTKALHYGDYADVMLDLRNLREQIDAILTSIPPTESTMLPPLLSPPTADENTPTK
jgi:hypothetical protein